MNAPMTKFAIMRANREKQRQIAAYGRIRSEIERAALGSQSQGPYYHADRNIKSYPFIKLKETS